MKTTFIVGAGASCEVGLPSGEQLKKKIGSSLDLRFNVYDLKSGDPETADALRHFARLKSMDVNVLIRAGHRIREAMPQAISIDNFVDVNGSSNHIEAVAKMAIATQILTAERNSKLAIYKEFNGVDTEFDFERVDGTWYSEFFKLLTENCPVARLPERLKDISLIVFNYDRCVERYLELALSNYYAIPRAKARDLVDQISIFHPYGSVGQLPKDGDGVQFGSRLSAPEIVNLIGQIKTFTEGTNPEDSNIVELRRRVIESHRLVFLGFAFHPMNVDLILPRDAIIDQAFERRVFGTSFGMSRDDCEVIEDDIRQRLQNRVSKYATPGVKCAELFQEYRRSLSLVPG